MARRADQFKELLKDMDGIKLKQLIAESKTALNNYEKKNSAAKKREDAIILRDQCKIGKQAYFLVKKQIFTGPVIGITADKVKIEMADKKAKGFPILKLVDSQKAKQMIIEGNASMAIVASEEGESSNEMDDKPLETENFEEEAQEAAE